MSETCQRLFFALWPDNATRRKISDTWDGISGSKGNGRRVPLTNLHLTLHFLGNIPDAQVDCYTQAARQVSVAPFELVLARTGYFSRAKVGWLGCEHIPTALYKLHAELGSRIERCGFVTDERPYHPHVTLQRKVRGPVMGQDFEPISWQVDRFVLVRSEIMNHAVHYRVSSSYPLRIEVSR